MAEVLTQDEASAGLSQLVADILRRVGNPEELALVGIRRGGQPIAEHIADLIEKTTNVRVPIGSVDITLYRDDAPAPLPNPRIGRTDVPFDVRSKKIVLVDDVLHTGRTVRAAMHALLDFGRSRAILLAVLVDRDGRELPIQPDFVVKTIEVAPDQQVEIFTENNQFRAVVSDRTSNELL